MTAHLRRLMALAIATLAISTTLVAFGTAAEAAVPAPATGLAATTSYTRAVLTWNAASGATHYRACIDGSPCAPLESVATGTTWTFTGLTPGARYDLVVYSYNTDGRAKSAPLNVVLPIKPPPDAPTGITQQVTLSSLTVSWVASAHTSTYSVCLMTALATETCARSSSRSSSLTATFSGLVPTAGGDYFYRVYAYNSVAATRSDKHRVDLPVADLQGITVPRVRTTSLRVTWHSATNAERYTVQVATNSAMTSSLATHVVPSGTLQYDVTGLTPGRLYYVRVRGENGVSLGAYSAILSIPLPTAAFSVDVITYNLCGQDHCRSSAAAKERIEPWSMRKPIAGRVVRGTHAELIATQESHDQDTKFITELPGYTSGSYYSAKTIFYHTSRFTRLAAGHITLDSSRGRYAVWNTLRDNATRTPFVFVDSHLEPYKGKTKDDLRAAQTKVLIAGIAKVNTKHLPVIFAGDYNSNKSNANQDLYPGGYDAPLKIFRGAGIPDGVNVAAYIVHQAFNSANQAINPPLKHSDHVDHIFVTPEIKVNRWSVILTRIDSLYATPFATDHNPVQTNLTIPGLPGRVG